MLIPPPPTSDPLISCLSHIGILGSLLQSIVCFKLDNKTPLTPNSIAGKEYVKMLTSQSIISESVTFLLIILSKKSNGLTDTPKLILLAIFPKLNVGYFSIIVSIASIYANTSLLSSLNLDIMLFFI